MQETGFLIGDPQYVMFKDEDFQMYAHAYDWMVEQYEKRTGILMNGNYPIWCWDQFPEDTLHHYVEDGDTGVVLEVELPDEHVLASEAYYWDVVSMKGSLHDRIEDYDSDIELTLAQKKVNWEKIFDKDWCYAHAMPTREPEYQHVVHRIELDQVRAVTTFTGRGDGLIDRIKCLDWRIRYRLGMKTSIRPHYESIRCQ